VTVDDGVPPVLSVIITAWNAERSIERSVGSVLDDAGEDAECIVVDDASTDRTADVVAAIAARDHRVRFERVSTNLGVSNARNVALDVARGTWLTFVDADDRILPGGLAALLRPTSDATIRAVVGQRIWNDGERTWIASLYDIPDIREPGRKSIGTHPGLVYYASVTGKVFHRSLADGLRFSGRALGDQPWAIRAMLRAGPDIEVIADDVYEWSRPHPDRPFETITSTSRGSASKAAEVGAVARGAFMAVAEEAERTIRDEAARSTLQRTYAERLFRSDFAVLVSRSMDRRDPATPDLFIAIGHMLEVIPGWILAGNEPLYRSLIQPPWKRWDELSASARHAYWRMTEPARRVDPTIDRRLLGSRRLIPLLRIARRASAVDAGFGSFLVDRVRGIAAILRERRVKPSVDAPEP
jgi:glycosyltransferase involved in cell wall biosynthesis